MRFNLRLHGRTADGKPCRAEITVYARSQNQLEYEAKKMAEDAAWYLMDGTLDEPPDGSLITVEHVEQLK